MTGYESKKKAAQDKLDDDDIQVYKDDGNALLIAYQSGYYDGKKQRPWVGLTNDEVNNFAAGCHLGKSVQGAIYEAEAKLKEKNT